MKTLQIELTPMEPYFFGMERGLAYGEVKTQHSLINPYFIKSSKLPTQTALLGVLRYLGIENPAPDFRLTAEDIANIGKSSFQMKGTAHAFGRIKGISSLALMDDKNHVLVRKPRNLDHLNKPFHNFDEVDTPEGTRLLPLDYNEKEYFGGGFYDLETGAVVTEETLFETDVRVGIKHDSEPESEGSNFTKKEYVALNDKFRFVFWAETEDDFKCYPRTVFIGQGRTSFAVKVSETQDPVAWEQLESVFPVVEGKVSHYIYLKSDLFYDGEMKELRKHCAFSITEGNDHRSLKTNYAAGTAVARYQKQNVLLKLISAGSVFLFKDEQQKESFKAELAKSENFEHGKVAGFNHYYESGENKR